MKKIILSMLCLPLILSVAGCSIVARGNLLTTHEEYGVCLKKGEVVK